MAKGVNLRRQFNELDPEIRDAFNIRILNVPCIIFSADESDNRTGTLLRMNRDGFAVVEVDGSRYRCNPDNVFVFDNDIGNNVRSSRFYEPAVFSESPRSYQKMYHQTYGMVSIVNKTSDLQGTPTYEIIPDNADAIDILNASDSGSGYYVAADEITNRHRFEHQRKPIYVHPSELIDPNHLKPEIRNKLMSTERLPRYQAFSSIEFIDGAYRRDKDNKTVKGYGMYEKTHPVAYSLDEDVYPLFNLPVKDIMDISIKKVSRSRTKGDVTFYNAEVTETKLLQPKGRPMVIVQGSDTGKLFITNASWLNKTDIEIDQLSMNFKLFKQVKDPKKLKNVSKDLAKAFKEKGEVTKSLDLSRSIVRKAPTYANPNKEERDIVQYNNPRDKWIYDNFLGRKEFKYKFVDPSSGENVVDDSPIIGDELIIADRVANTSSTTVSKDKHVQAIKNCEKEIKSLGIKKVTCKLTEQGGVVTAVNAKGEWSFEIITIAGELAIQTGYNISDKAKELFVKLVDLMSNI
jgi:hypothetical protein